MGYMKITRKSIDSADIEGIVHADDAILFAREATRLLAEDLSSEMKEKFLSEAIVSILRASCSHTEAKDTLEWAKRLLEWNHAAIGTPKGD
jgi:hypothetical protein